MKNLESHERTFLFHLQLFEALFVSYFQCLSANGKELTRISIVNENLDVIYDTYVKPEAPITDYLTQ